MHQIHKTPGFILGHKNIGEANRYFYIYTRDFGLISASAQSVRKGASKLRGHLQDFSLVNLELVRGRELWRITGASIWQKNKEFEFLKNFSRLLRRLCPGEEKNEKLFEHVQEVVCFSESRFFDLHAFECVAVLKMLHLLGYVGESENLSFFVTGVLDEKILQKAKENHRLLVSEINKSLKESQL